MRKINVKSISCIPFDKTYVQCGIQTHFVTNEYIRRNKNLFKNHKYPSTMVQNIMYSERQPPPLGGSQTSGFGTDDIGHSRNLWSTMLSKLVMFVIETLTCVINSHYEKRAVPLDKNRIRARFTQQRCIFFCFCYGVEEEEIMQLINLCFYIYEF